MSSKLSILNGLLKNIVFERAQRSHISLSCLNQNLKHICSSHLILILHLNILFLLFSAKLLFESYKL